MTSPSPPNVYPQPLVEINSITFWWLPPESDGGQPIQSYTLECASPPLTFTYGPDQTNTYIPNLSPFTQYSFSLKATNVIGDSDVAYFDTVTTGHRPGPPTSITSSEEFYSPSSQITWNIPAYDGGSPVFDYVVSATAYNASNARVPEKDILLSADTPSSTSLYPLEDYDYEVQVQAINSCGYSPKSSAVWVKNTIRPGSIVFNGTSNYCAITDATNPSPFALSTTDFTLEFFFKVSSLTDTPYLFCSSTASGEAFSLQLQNPGSGYQYLLKYPSASTVEVEAFGSVTEGWHHIAIVGETQLTTRLVNIYLDGTLYHTTTSPSYSFTQNLLDFTIGQKTIPTTTTNFQGFITNLRFVTGLAVYISDFVLPNIPLGVIGGSGVLTELLLTVENVGNKLVDTSGLNRTVSDFGTGFSIQHP